MKFNIKAVIHIMGLLLMINAGFMVLTLPAFFVFQEKEWKDMAIAILITATTGFGTWILTRQKQPHELTKRDGYLIVSLGWLIMSLFGAIPFMLSGAIPGFTDAFFETVSGYTTTGASIMTEIEGNSKGILLWRSLIQWIGGMGIIVLAVAILPLLGIGGMQLFIAEAPGITPEKLAPRIKETAKRLWMVYVALTLAEIILLNIAGMSYYDAVCHAFTTMATGGFSTKNASIAYYTSPAIHYIIIIFMILAGTNFTINYYLLTGHFSRIKKSSEEFKVYLLFTLITTLIVTAGVFLYTGSDLERSFRDSLFQVVSIITTTGYVTADYNQWGPFLLMLFFILMFTGGMAGSTAGGIKTVRHLLLIKNGFLEMKRQIHKSAIIPVRLNGKAIDQNTIFHILAFLMLYIAIFGMGALTMALFGLDLDTAMGASITCLGNIGPGIGSVGPVSNFAHLPAGAKWVLSFLMLIGRLEIFTFLILFTPFYWRRY